MVTYLISDNEVCSHENLQMPFNKQGSNTRSRLQRTAALTVPEPLFGKITVVHT